MDNQKQYKMDGIYYRVKREGKWQNVCFSDMTVEERDEIIGERTAGYWRQVADYLANQLRNFAIEAEAAGIEVGFGEGGEDE